MRLHHKTNRFSVEPLEARQLLAFAAPVSHTMGGSGAGLMSVVAGDLNGDGRLDLASNGGLLWGNANGTFQPAGAADTGAPMVGVGDFNGDAKLDLVSRANGINLYLNNGNGMFGQPRFTNLFAPCMSAAVGDINGDGKLDVIASLIEYGGYADAVVLIGNGGG